MYKIDNAAKSTLVMIVFIIPSVERQRSRLLAFNVHVEPDTSNLTKSSGMRCRTVKLVLRCEGRRCGPDLAHVSLIYTVLTYTPTSDIDSPSGRHSICSPFQRSGSGFRSAPSHLRNCTVERPTMTCSCSFPIGYLLYMTGYSRTTKSIMYQMYQCVT